MTLNRTDNSELDQKMDLVECEIVLGAWITRFRWCEQFYRKLYIPVDKVAFCGHDIEDEEDLQGSS